MSRTKIIATIGPKTNNSDSLLALREAGMSAARLNGSHADAAWHRSAIALLREIVPDVPVLLDIPGRKIRTGVMEQLVEFSPGETVVFTSRPDMNGHGKVPVNHNRFHEIVSVGHEFLVDDGRLCFTVTSIKGEEVFCRAHSQGMISSRKGINLPSLGHDLEVLTAKDQEMLMFAKETGVDFIGISFVDSALQVEKWREILGSHGPSIVSKIENQPGLNNVEEIFGVSDAIMIDRGDLSAETSIESVILSQKKILRSARRHCKPVIVATEMLHSMIEHSLPTKAEISDISNAVIDGASALMLSGETAIGLHPVEAVRMMRRIASAVEESRETPWSQASQKALSVPEAMGEAIALLCRHLPVTKIVAITISGYAARSIAAFAPRQRVLAVSNNAVNARRFNLLPGVTGVHYDIEFSRVNTNHVPQCLKQLWLDEKIVDDDLILVTAVGYPRSGNRMNMIETHYVRDLREGLGWC
ncbi:MAG: pyruvate kinase [Elusimicrobia bacterium]|nr:pyruvate kinase [Elusimicrobiota bacterium]